MPLKQRSGIGSAWLIGVGCTETSSRSTAPDRWTEPAATLRLRRRCRRPPSASGTSHSRSLQPGRTRRQPPVWRLMTRWQPRVSRSTRWLWLASRRPSALWNIGGQRLARRGLTPSCHRCAFFVNMPRSSTRSRSASPPCLSASRPRRLAIAPPWWSWNESATPSMRGAAQAVMKASPSTSRSQRGADTRPSLIQSVTPLESSGLEVSTEAEALVACK
mmetsp:Transcript_66004/g.166385  ORF Transcript_66004/g.166385 Transcript_66004/m.166385 type:complete len:218 (+) Transcript_66004:257-910(+)